MDVAWIIADWLGLDPTPWDLLDLGFRVLGLVSVPSVLIQRRGRPRAALSWTLGLLLAPHLVVLMWWLLGRTYLERKRKRRRAATETLQDRLVGMREALEAARAGEHDESIDEWLPEGHVHTRLALSGVVDIFPARGGNRVQLLDGAEAAYEAIEAAVEAATDHVHFLFYIWQADATGRRFRDLLARKAAEGVEVRVLYDAVGGAAVHGRFMAPLRQAGAHVGALLPLRFLRRKLTLNFRNHRKIVVVDGRIGFLGGVNIGDEYLGWHDLALSLEGPVVRQLQQVFAEDWYDLHEEDLVAARFYRAPRQDEGRQGFVAMAQIVASGPDHTYNPTRHAIFESMTAATRRIWITTPYFVPGDAVLTALKAASFRGVDVRVMVPGKNDVRTVQWASRSLYHELLDAGIRLFEYQGKVLHAKAGLFDEDWAMVGSANMDARSFRLNFEVSCFVYGQELNHALAERFRADMADCVEVTAEARAAISRLTQLGEAVAHLFSPIL